MSSADILSPASVAKDNTSPVHCGSIFHARPPHVNTNNLQKNKANQPPRTLTFLKKRSGCGQGGLFSAYPRGAAPAA